MSTILLDKHLLVYIFVHTCLDVDNTINLHNTFV